MGRGVVVRGGASGTRFGSCSLHVWSDGGEGGGEVVEGSVVNPTELKVFVTQTLAASLVLL